MRYFLIYLISIVGLFACNHNKGKDDNSDTIEVPTVVKEELIEQNLDTVIIDSRYTFAEAIEGSNAPENVIEKLDLIDVTYISTDEKLHQGQILTNKRLVSDLEDIFQFMLNQNFVIEKAIPIVAYNWSDSLSMANNNTYSFCYRNVTYSLHAKGLAIDINPRFNPLRWKTKDIPNEPYGTILDTTVNGTLYPEHAVVKEFRRRGFRWGNTFSKYWDDHHFERK